MFEMINVTHFMCCVFCCHNYENSLLSGLLIIALKPVFKLKVGKKKYLIKKVSSLYTLILNILYGAIEVYLKGLYPFILAGTVPL